MEICTVFHMLQHHCRLSPRICHLQNRPDDLTKPPYDMVSGIETASNKIGISLRQGRPPQQTDYSYRLEWRTALVVTTLCSKALH